MRTFVLIPFVLGLGCTSSSSDEGCRNNSGCASGQVCVDGECEVVCAADNHCPNGEICRDSICKTGTRQTPEIVAVDGDEDIVCPNAGGTHCMELGIEVDGRNLEGAAFDLQDEEGILHALGRRDVGSDAHASLFLPNVAPGDFVLVATNAAGSDQAPLTLLQGSPDTAEQILGKLVTVDGSGSQLDADLLDGADVATLIDQAVAAAVPAGTVVPFAGAADVVPAGWLLCDGAAVDRSAYPDLFDVVGIAHGGGDGVSTFNLPDYRGRFLRGVDHGAGNDPDAATRTVLHPVNTDPDRVGSLQGDAFASHAHHLPIAANDGTVWGIDQSSQGGFTGTHVRNTEAVGAAETRPMNAYVNWIIKF